MSKLSSLALAVRRRRQFLANRGVRATVQTLLNGILRRLRPGAPAGEPASELWRNSEAVPPAHHPFDVAHGTNTSGLIWGEDLLTGHRHDAWNTAYYGIAPSVFDEALESLRDRSGLDFSRFTFIDLGSGKGRAVLLASRLPFSRVLGVELSPQLHSVALENLKVFLAQAAGPGAPASRVSMLRADAADFPWNADLHGPLLFFLYNPFSRPVLEKFLKRLRSSLRADPREVYFVFINPELDAAMTRQGWIERLWQQTMTIGAADQQADRFGSTTENVAAYRVRL